MKQFVKFFAMMFLLLASSKVALAGPLTGTMTIGGAGATFSSTQITFSNPNNYNIVSTIPGFTAPPIGYALFSTPFVLANASQPGGETLFAVPNMAGTQLLIFTVTSDSLVTDPITDLGKYYFYGTLEVYNYNGTTVTGSPMNITASSAVLTETPGGGGFSMYVTTTPEPNSLILLGTGLVGAAGAVFRKRKAMMV